MLFLVSHGQKDVDDADVVGRATAAAGAAKLSAANNIPIDSVAIK